MNLISLEIAKQLQSLGFKEQCLHWFYIPDNAKPSSHIYCEEEMSSPYYIRRPDYDQVLNWFFEEHNLFSDFMFDDMRWQGNYGEFCIPDYNSDTTIYLPESEGFKDAKLGFFQIKEEVIKEMISKTLKDKE